MPAIHQRRKRRLQSRCARLHLESLEQRCLLAELVGIDFDSNSFETPPSWNTVDSVNTLYDSLTDESGLESGIGFQANYHGFGTFSFDQTGLNCSDVPDHDPSLCDLNGALVVSNAGQNNFEVMFEGLFPNTNYDVYVFGHHDQQQTVEQEVTLAFPFQQVLNRNDFWSNEHDGRGIDLEFKY